MYAHKQVRVYVKYTTLPPPPKKAPKIRALLKNEEKEKTKQNRAIKRQKKR